MGNYTNSKINCKSNLWFTLQISGSNFQTGNVLLFSDERNYLMITETTD